MKKSTFDHQRSRRRQHLPMFEMLSRTLRCADRNRRLFPAGLLSTRQARRWLATFVNGELLHRMTRFEVSAWGLRQAGHSMSTDLRSRQRPSRNRFGNPSPQFRFENQMNRSLQSRDLGFGAEPAADV